MNERIKMWLEQEMKDFSVIFREFNKKLMKKVPLYMGVCVVGLVALGFLAGGDAASVFKLHFPIGCGIAVFIWLCYWIQGRSVSMKKVQTSYENAISSFFKSEEDKESFVKQMEMQNYGKIDFMNNATDKYPSRFVAGPDYWIFFKELYCCFIRVSDIKSIYGKEEQTRVSYNTGSTQVRQNVAIGVSLVVEYKENSASAGEKQEDKLYLENGEQFKQVKELIKKYCPGSEEFIS